MSIVLDASLTLAWCFHDEATPSTTAALSHVGREGADVPDLWIYEIANGIASGLRRMPPRISEVEANKFIEALADLPIRVRPSSGIRDLIAIRSLASKHGISAYDAAYLHLARELEIPLGTLDGSGRRTGLRQAAAAAGVPLFHANP